MSDNNNTLEVFLKLEKMEIEERISQEVFNRYYKHTKGVPRKQEISEFKSSEVFLELVKKELESNEVYRSVCSGTMPDDEQMLLRYQKIKPDLDEMSGSGISNPKTVKRELGKKERERQEQLVRTLKKEARHYYEGLDLAQIFDLHMDEMSFDLKNKVEKYFIKKRLFLNSIGLYEYYDNFRKRDDELSVDNIDTYLRNLVEFSEIDDVICYVASEGESPVIWSYLFARLLQFDRTLGYYVENGAIGEFIIEDLTDIPSGNILLERVEGYFDKDHLISLIGKNKRYAQIIREYRDIVTRRDILLRDILTEIPENYIDLYPSARKMHRHFILHIGGTNSGKTHDAVEALMQCEKGAYLAPLRLLAYEQYEYMNRYGCVCSLITGEEKRIEENASHCSSTIEMADLDEIYDVVVIDEAQMIADPNRGGGWTASILGILAYEIHVCLAPEAEGIIKKLIENCSDSYEVIYHTRKAELKFEKDRFRFPGSVKKGDALVVFSRKDVHAVASELHARAVKCSIIYGALPYDVRHKEAERFSEGETDVVVATDAIGMGLNLPIRRVVFLRTEKFDGKSKRELGFNEIKQIAGRAGRYGLYDVGYINVLGDRYLIEDGITADIRPIEKAVVSFPENLVSLDGELSEIMERWNEITDTNEYEKSSIETEIMLARIIEEYTDDKVLTYRLVMIPFDEKDDELLKLWKQMAILLAHGDNIDGFFMASYHDRKSDGKNIDKLEHIYRVYDLLYAFADRFGYGEYCESILQRKNEVSHMIMDILSKQKLKERKCKKCGRRIPWNYPYSICDNCYRKKQNF